MIHGARLVVPIWKSFDRRLKNEQCNCIRRSLHVQFTTSERIPCASRFILEEKCSSPGSLLWRSQSIYSQNGQDLGNRHPVSNLFSFRCGDKYVSVYSRFVCRMWLDCPQSFIAVRNSFQHVQRKPKIITPTVLLSTQAASCRSRTGIESSSINAP